MSGVGGTALSAVVDGASIVVTVGSGGVGKTTVAAAIAQGAAEAGRRVCVITVDPARRLADALGGDELGPRPTQLAGGAQLWAMMLDPKHTFDRLVGEHAPDQARADDILGNAFYQKLSTSLAGVHEFMAVEELLSLAGDDRFDLLVVDTPPSRHALDLLDAPGRLTRFLDNRMYRTLVRPATGVARLATAPARAFAKRVASAVGGQFLDDAIGFFEAFAGMEAGFAARARAAGELLADPSTAFVAITTPRPDAIEVATEMRAELESRHITLAAAVTNMTTFDPWPELEPHLDAFASTPELRLRAEALRDRHARAEAELQLLAPVSQLTEVVVNLPRRRTEVSDLAALAELGAELIPPATTAG